MANENRSQGFWTPNILASLIVPVIAGIFSVFAALITVNKVTDPLQQATLGPLSKGQKLCSIFIPGNWRDTLIVPQQWNIGNCQELQREMKAADFQLGCVYERSISLGKHPEQINDPSDPSERRPQENCGW